MRVHKPKSKIKLIMMKIWKFVLQILVYLSTFITLGLLLLFIFSLINLVFSLLKSVLCTFLLEKVGLYIALIFTIIITVYFPTNLIRLFSFLFGKSSNYKIQIMHILDLLTKVLRPRILIYVISSIIAILSSLQNLGVDISIFTKLIGIDFSVGLEAVVTFLTLDALIQLLKDENLSSKNYINEIVKSIKSNEE